MADWYLKHGDKEYGPMDSNKLKQLAAQNKIRPTDYIRRGADGKWTLASHAKGLFSDTASNDPSAPSPINVHSGDANTGAPQPVPPVAPTPNPAFSQTPPIAPPVASAIPVAQKASSASSASSSMSFGDGIEFTSNSSASSSPKKGKKGKKKGSAPMDKKTVLIASAAGGAVLALILIIVLIVVLSGKKDNSNNAQQTEQTTTQTEEGTEAAPAEGEDDQEEPGFGEVAPANEDEQTEDGANPDEQPAEQVAIPENVYDSATQSAKVGDMEIKVVSIRQGSEPIITKGGAEDDSPDRSTIITVSVQNINPQKAVKFTPWSISLASGKKSNISLTDKENTYGFALKPGEYSKNVKKETKTLYSDDPPVTDVLIFERYVPGAKELFLTLPVPGDSSQTVVFRIKTENVGGSAAKSSAANKSEADAEEPDAAQEDNKSESPVVSESAPAEDFNPDDDDEYNEMGGVSEAAQKKEEEKLEAELKDMMKE